MPAGTLDLLLGYAIAFGVARAQAPNTAAVAVVSLDLSAAGPAWLLLAVAVVDAVLGAISDVLPFSYAVHAMRDVQLAADPDVWGELAVVAGFCVVSLALGAATLRRRTP